MFTRACVVELSPVDLNLEVPEFAGSEMFMMGPPGAYGLLPETQVSLALSPGSIPAPSYPNSRREEPVHMNKSAWSRPSGWWAHVYWALTLDRDLKAFFPDSWFVFGIAMVIVSRALLVVLGQFLTFTLPELANDEGRRTAER